MPAQKSLAKITGTSAASTLHCQGKRCWARRRFGRGAAAAAALMLQTHCPVSLEVTEPCHQPPCHHPKALQWLKLYLKNKQTKPQSHNNNQKPQKNLQTLACLFKKKKKSHWQATNTQEHLQRSCYSLSCSNPWIKVINSTQWHTAMTTKVLFWLVGYIEWKHLTNIYTELVSSESSKEEKKQENPEER